jgi:hypothetical protein
MIKRAIEHRRNAIAEDRAWLQAKKAILEQAEQKLMKEVQTLAA